MVKLIWTDQAIDDLEGIGDYIADNSEKYAKLTIQRIYEKAEILKVIRRREEWFQKRMKKMLGS